MQDLRLVFHPGPYGWRGFSHVKRKDVQVQSGHDDITDWVLKGEGGGMMTPLLQYCLYVARFDGFDRGGRDCWVWRGRLQGKLAVVLPVCRIPVSICCAKRRATSFTRVLEGDKPIPPFSAFSTPYFSPGRAL